MKALLVYENIHFERGKDPKSILRIVKANLLNIIKAYDSTVFTPYIINLPGFISFLEGRDQKYTLKDFFVDVEINGEFEHLKKLEDLEGQRVLILDKIYQIPEKTKIG